jgi:hypothetical protein
MKKYLKYLLIALGVALVVIQFIHPAKNQSNNNTNSITTRYDVPEPVLTVLKTACFDCHSNSTVYPWYANIQPVAWWLADHVNDGKKHLNFSEFTTRKIAVQNHKLEEVIEQLKEGEMPLNSYTWIHKEANLSPEQKNLLINWAQTTMDSIKAHYPADSLVMKSR